MSNSVGNVLKCLSQPIKQLNINFITNADSGTNESFNISLFDESTEFNIKPITRKDDKGFPRVVSYMFEGKFDCVQSVLSDFNKLLYYIDHYEVGYYCIVFIDDTSLFINGRDLSSPFNNGKAQWEHSHKNDEPSIKLTLNAFADNFINNDGNTFNGF